MSDPGGPIQKLSQKKSEFQPERYRAWMELALGSLMQALAGGKELQTSVQVLGQPQAKPVKSLIL